MTGDRSEPPGGNICQKYGFDGGNYPDCAKYCLLANGDSMVQVLRKIISGPRPTRRQTLESIADKLEEQAAKLRTLAGEEKL